MTLSISKKKLVRTFELKLNFLNLISKLENFLLNNSNQPTYCLPYSTGKGFSYSKLDMKNLSQKTKQLFWTLFLKITAFAKNLVTPVFGNLWEIAITI